MNERYFNLLKQWCDRLIELQLDESFGPLLEGGVICPACHYAHGRSGDAIYLMLTMAKITNDKKYLDCALKLYEWTEKAMAMPDGSMINDAFSNWKGISAFTAIGLCEALHYHSDLLDNETVHRWKNRIKELTDFVVPYIDNMFSAVNYKLALPATLAYTGKILGDESYIKSAREHAEIVYNYITPENLIFGEPKSGEFISEKGCYRVDIGYNVEESIYLLLQYANLLNDQKMKDLVLKLTKAHSVFYLPDGAIDNSFGTRSAKWSYWGSRTSDGCQPLFTSLADEDPDYSEIAERNFELLEKCTSDGLLHGGLMYATAKEAACTHHSFCHAKVLAHLLDKNYTPKERVALSTEKGDFYRYFDSLHVSILRKGDFRATVSDYDVDIVNGNTFCSGGSITLLYHNKIGAIFAASVPEYFLVEPTNMQYSKHTGELCQTLRIEYKDGNRVYSSIYDKKAKVETTDGYNYKVSGALCNKNQNALDTYNMQYEFNENKVTLNFSSNHDATLYLPIIAASNENVQNDGKKVTVHKENAKLVITSNLPITSKLGEEKRNFNHCGGFETYYAEVELKDKINCEITITVE